jgi:hypothetical protein
LQVLGIRKWNQRTHQFNKFQKPQRKLKELLGFMKEA